MKTLVSAVLCLGFVLFAHVTLVNPYTSLPYMPQESSMTAVQGYFGYFGTDMPTGGGSAFQQFQPDLYVFSQNMPLPAPYSSISHDMPGIAQYSIAQDIPVPQKAQEDVSSPTQSVILAQDTSALTGNIANNQLLPESLPYPVKPDLYAFAQEMPAPLPYITSPPVMPMPYVISVNMPVPRRNSFAQDMPTLQKTTENVSSPSPPEILAQNTSVQTRDMTNSQLLPLAAPMPQINPAGNFPVMPPQLPSWSVNPPADVYPPDGRMPYPPVMPPVQPPTVYYLPFGEQGPAYTEVIHPAFVQFAPAYFPGTPPPCQCPAPLIMPAWYP